MLRKPSDVIASETVSQKNYWPLLCAAAHFRGRTRTSAVEKFLLRFRLFFIKMKLLMGVRRSDSNINSP
jgi:hypothetical protein